MARPRDPEIDQRIHDAVVELLSTDGYATMTMEGVADRARVSKPSVYRRWPTLAHLVFEVQARATLPAPLPDTGSFGGDLRATIRSFVDVAAHTDRALLADQFATMILDGDFARRFFDEVMQPLNRQATAMYERARSRGEVREDIDPVEVMRDLAGQLIVRVVVLHDPPDDDTLDDMVDRAVNGVRRA